RDLGCGYGVVRAGIERVAAELLDQPFALAQKAVDDLGVLPPPLRLRRQVRRARDELAPFQAGNVALLARSPAFGGDPFGRLAVRRADGIDRPLPVNDLHFEVLLHRRSREWALRTALAGLQRKP